MKADLSQDMMLNFKSIHGRNAHLGQSTEYLAQERIVVFKTWGSRKRLWGLLPNKRYPSTRDVLEIPDDITTEQELRRFVKKHRRSWIKG